MKNTKGYTVAELCLFVVVLALILGCGYDGVRVVLFSVAIGLLITALIGAGMLSRFLFKKFQSRKLVLQRFD